MRPLDAIAALCLLGAISPAHATIDMALDTSNYQNDGTAFTASVNGVIDDSTDPSVIVGAAVMVRFDPSKVSISNLHTESGSGWSLLRSNTLHTGDGWVKGVLYNNSDPGQTEDGPILEFTVTPANSTVDPSDCDTLKFSGSESDMCDDQFDDYIPSDPCTGIYSPPGQDGATSQTRGGFSVPTGQRSGSRGPMGTSGGCDPDIVTTIQALRYASGLDTVPYESMADFDSDNDGYITILDAVRVLLRPCPPNVTASPWTFDAQTASGSPYPSVLLPWNYTITVPVEFEIERQVPESTNWLPMGTVDGTAGTHSYQWPDLFLVGSKQYSYRVRTVYNYGTPSALYGQYSTTATATTNSDPDFSNTTDPLPETDPRSWVPIVAGPLALDDAETDMPTGDYRMWWYTGVYDNETGISSTIPFDPNEPDAPSGGATGGESEVTQPSSNSRNRSPMTFTHDNRDRAIRRQVPFSAICKIVVKYSNGDVINGTGTVIDSTRRIVLTAAHCVVRKRGGKTEYPPLMWVLPCAFQNPTMAFLQAGPPYNGSGSFADYGIAHVLKTYFWNKYDTKFDQRDDVAVLKLGGGNYVNAAGVMAPLGYVNADQNIDKPFTMAGYPYEDDGKDGWTMYEGTGRTHRWWSPPLSFGYGKYIVATDLDANGGDSGGPLWNSERGGYDTIFAIMTMLGARGKQTDSDSNALVLSPEKCAWITKMAAK